MPTDLQKLDASIAEKQKQLNIPGVPQALMYEIRLRERIYMESQRADAARRVVQCDANAAAAVAVVESLADVAKDDAVRPLLDPVAEAELAKVVIK